jgi:hypothetical protein
MISPIPAFGSIAAVLVLCGCAASGAVHDTPTAMASACLKDSGSPFPPSVATCIPGRSYSRSDIDNTGATTAARALRQLDPSITIGH